MRRVEILISESGKKKAKVSWSEGRKCEIILDWKEDWKEKESEAERHRRAAQGKARDKVRRRKRKGGRERHVYARAHTGADRDRERERERESEGRRRGTERLVFATGRTLSKVNDSIIAMGGSRVVGTNGVGRSSRRSAREVQERIGPRKKVSPISVRTVRRDRFATSSSVLPVRCRGSTSFRLIYQLTNEATSF